MGSFSSAMGGGCSADLASADGTVERSDDGRIEILQIRAVLNGDGSSLRRKHPLKWVRRTRPQSIPYSDGALCLRIGLANERVSEIPFDAYVEGDTVDGPKLFGGFTLEIPVPPGEHVEQVEIKRLGGDVLVVWPAGEVPPRN